MSAPDDNTELKKTQDKAVLEYHSAVRNKRFEEKIISEEIEKEQSAERDKERITLMKEAFREEKTKEIHMLTAIVAYEKSRSPKHPEGHAVKMTLDESTNRKRQEATHQEAKLQLTNANERHAREEKERCDDIKKTNDLITELQLHTKGTDHVQCPKGDAKLPITVRLVCIDMQYTTRGIITINGCAIATTFRFDAPTYSEQKRGSTKQSESLCKRLAGKLALALYDAWGPYEFDEIHNSLIKHCNPNADTKQATRNFIIGLQEKAVGEYVLLVYSTQDKVRQMQPSGRFGVISSMPELSGYYPFNKWLHETMLAPVFEEKYTLANQAYTKHPVTKPVDLPHKEPSQWRRFGAPVLATVGLVGAGTVLYNTVTGKKPSDPVREKEVAFQPQVAEFAQPTHRA